MTATPEKLTIRAHALLDAMRSHDHQHSTAHFDTALTTLMPPDKVEELWTQLEAQAGPFVAKVADRIETADKASTVIMTCKFAKAEIDLRISFDASGNIIGIFVAPAPVVDTPQANPAADLA